MFDKQYTILTNEEMTALARECITNMVNSMTSWNGDLLLMFYQLYTEKFCINCGRKIAYYKQFPSPCICTDDFISS